MNYIREIEKYLRAPWLEQLLVAEVFTSSSWGNARESKVNTTQSTPQKLQKGSLSSLLGHKHDHLECSTGYKWLALA